MSKKPNIDDKSQEMRDAESYSSLIHHPSSFSSSIIPHPSSFNYDRWQEVEAIFQDALDRPAHERASFLEQTCLDDVELRNEAATLIVAHDNAGDFIEQPALVHDAQIIFSHTDGNNIGREIGSYRIVDRLGAGGMGEVYLAQDSRLDRLVALKLLPAYFASDDERLARFQREARSTSALNHPNILTIHEVGEADGVRFIATEFIDGDTLQKLISDQEMKLAEILDVVIQVASGLAAAHAADIVHRDIKPDNIMRRGDGLVKLLDFGIAKLLEPVTSEAGLNGTMHTETGAVVGTVGYMSPEQARGLTVDKRTDIWSLGVVLYQLLTRRLPFTGMTRMDTLVNILERAPDPLLPAHRNESFSELAALQGLLMKSLRKDRDERYQTVNEFLADLRSVRQDLESAGMCDGQTLSDLLPGSRVFNRVSESKTSSSTRRSPGRYVFLALGFAVLLLAILAGAFIYKSRITTRPGILNAPARATNSGKVYTEMSDAEQLAFIRSEEQRISSMMGDRPGKLDQDALRAIKRYVDFYAARRGSDSDAAGKEDIRVVYARARPYLPTIARAFAVRKVPTIIGIYLPMIESEYRPCSESSIGGKGPFQFLPQTAKAYGVSPDDRCNMDQMAPAAAHYIADHMADLGDDAESMTLVLLSYNHGATWVRGALRQLRTADDYERTFWTLFKNRELLGPAFRNEGAGYVPMFFAAAIVGENPQNFGLDMPPLSSLTSANGATSQTNTN
jgi:serine/threonine protein kinase